jgi:hypothetical protein
MPILSIKDAEKEREDIRLEIASLEAEKKSIDTRIRSLEEYLELLEYKWGLIE